MRSVLRPNRVRPDYFYVTEYVVKQLNHQVTDTIGDLIYTEVDETAFITTFYNSINRNKPLI